MSPFGLSLGVLCCVANSKISVVRAIDEPISGGDVAVHAIDRGAGFDLQSDVPLVALPAVVRPPLTGGAPRAGARGDLGTRVLEERDPCGLAGVHVDARAERRAVETQGE